MSEMNAGKRIAVDALEYERRERKRRAALWSAVWEASQTMSFDEIRLLVERTLSEIESDQP